MSASLQSPNQSTSLSRYALLAIGFALCAIGGYREIGILAALLALSVAISWVFLPSWYAFSIGELGFIAAAQSPSLPSLVLVNVGLGCILCSDWSYWGSGTRLTIVRIGYGAVVGLLVLWIVHQLFADVWITASVFGITGACIFYLLYRYHHIKMGLTEEQYE